ncbi:chemotaxis protein CheB [Glaciecola sp. 1036]|uniref:chemotaxis protein CheB n=1 Tax=Alteromonadaceae TaxID=72275 RepID=UPI003D01ED6C
MNDNQNNKIEVPVIGVGASAGGLEALQALVSNLPIDLGACVVIVQHLFPDYKSMMQELLQKHTDLEVETIESVAEILPNKIYLLPPKKNVTIYQDSLHLEHKNQNDVPNFGINKFFVSLAEQKKSNAIAIVLSGTGSDGSKGLKHVKEFGGLTLVQKPETAKFDGMPMSAIHTGDVDFILAPDEMGEKLHDYFESHEDLSKGVLKNIDVESFKNKNVFAEILEYIHENFAIDFSAYKKNTLIRRMQRRMYVFNCDSMSEYFSILQKDDKEAEKLKQDFLIGVTQFFRDKEPYTFLTNHVIPKIVREATGDDPIRVWCVACSTGEEIYSLAILFLEELEKQGKSNLLKCFATDVNKDAILWGSQGLYSKDIEADVPEHLLNKYFVQVDEDHYQVVKKLRKAIAFAEHDALLDVPFSKVSFISCRNVLIYFNHESQTRILSSIFFSLCKNGYLFLGKSENLGEISTKFSEVSRDLRVFKKISSERIILNQHQTGQSNMEKNYTANSKIPPIESLLSDYRRRPNTQSLGFANEALILNCFHPCLLLSEDLHILQIHGDITPFVRSLVPNKLGGLIDDIIHEDLLIATKSIIDKAKESKSPVTFTDLTTLHQGEYVNVNIRGFYLKEHDIESELGYIWLVFDKKSEVDDENILKYDPESHANQRIKLLEAELLECKEALKHAIEDLETTNEELQSANEELMSSNEELQSTNEELQSVNEELYTVNSEYQDKISEISQTNADLDNVLALSQIGILFLDDEFNIRFFTEEIKKYINLRQTDVSRPLHHLSKSFSYDEMINDVENAFKNDEKIEKEITMKSKHIVRVSIYPYKYNDLANSSGVVITFNDITQATYAEKGLVVAYKELYKIVDYSLHQNTQFDPSKINLLLIEDNDAYMEICHVELSKITDFEVVVHSAKSVEQASFILANIPIDVCLCDYYLSSETAIDLVEKFDNEISPVPTIVMTGDLNDGIVPLLICHGLLDLVEKDDISSEFLAKRIKSAIQRFTLSKT